MKNLKLLWLGMLTMVGFVACSKDDGDEELLPGGEFVSLAPVITGFEQNVCDDYSRTHYKIKVTITAKIKLSAKVIDWGLRIYDKDNNLLKECPHLISTVENTDIWIYEDYLSRSLFIEGTTILRLTTYAKLADGDYVYGRTINEILEYGRVVFSCPDTHHPHLVDLCLSSGTKWACCNVGAFVPSDYGNYYAWGETSPKSEFLINGSVTNGKMMSDISGNSRYDAACANWGGGWRLPTKSELQELLDECSWTWTTINDKRGYNVIGQNGNSIFLPAAGCRGGTAIYDDGFFCDYWTSTPYEGSVDHAYCLYYRKGNFRMYWDNRYYGRSVRPVSE